MATQAQIEANRRNAVKSTGPRTADGKARVRHNAARHSLCSSIALLREKDREQFDLLLADLREEHQPASPTEDILVFKMAEHMFFGWRSGNALARQFEANPTPENLAQAALLLRYHTTADRGFLKNLRELRKLKKERELEEIGSVSQNPENQPQNEPEEQPEPRSEAAPSVCIPAADAKVQQIYQKVDNLIHHALKNCGLAA